MKVYVLADLDYSYVDDADRETPNVEIKGVYETLADRRDFDAREMEKLRIRELHRERTGEDATFLDMLGPFDIVLAPPEAEPQETTRDASLSACVKGVPTSITMVTNQ